MKILALELSSARGSLAWRDDALPASVATCVQDWPNDRKNSGTFFRNLAEVKQQFGVPEKIVAGLGPGSYAGTRIAISTAIGLQLASAAQLAGYPSICAIETDAAEYCVIGDARRQSFFFARIRDRDVVEGPDLLVESGLRAKIDNLACPIFATEELPQFARVEQRYPSAKVLARLAAEANRRFVLPPLEPMYLREPHITQPKSR